MLGFGFVAQGTGACKYETIQVVLVRFGFRGFPSISSIRLLSFLGSSLWVLKPNKE